MGQPIKKGSSLEPEQAPTPQTATPNIRKSTVGSEENGKAGARNGSVSKTDKRARKMVELNEV